MSSNKGHRLSGEKDGGLKEMVEGKQKSSYFLLNRSDSVRASSKDHPG